MRIVNTLKFSTKSINPIGLALGAVYVTAGAVALKVGVQSLVFGMGFRGEFTVFK